MSVAIDFYNVHASLVELGQRTSQIPNERRGPAEVTGAEIGRLQSGTTTVAIIRRALSPGSSINEISRHKLTHLYFVDSHMQIELVIGDDMLA